MRHLACFLLLLSAACNADDKVLRLEVRDLAVTTMEDTPLSVQVPVVTNARLEARVVTQPSHGTLTTSGVAEGTVYTYTPAENYTGTDTIAVAYDNGETEETGTVTITVTPVNDGPVAGPDSFASGFAAPLTVAASTLLTNDTDDDSTGLTVTGVSVGTHGAVSFSGGQVVFVPEANYQGIATFTYTISDGTATGHGNVTVTVGNNRPPVASNDAATGTEDAAVNVATTALLSNDTDQDMQTLAVSGVGNPTNGTVSLTGTMVTFIPAENFNGTATFDYFATDGADTDTGTVTVTVSAVNDQPLAGADLGTTAEDSALTIDAASLLANDSDPDGTALTVSTVSGATNGTVALAGSTVTFMPAADFNGTGSFSYTASDGTATATGTVTVTVTPVNDGPAAVNDAVAGTEDTVLTLAASSLIANDTDVEGDTLLVSGVGTASIGSVSLSSGSISYAPPANYGGPATFTYTVSDGAIQSTATVTITVAPVNDAPVSVDDTVTTAEDTAVNAAVLTNDGDIDGPALALMSVAQPLHGTTSFTGTMVTYTPAANYAGPDQFTYVATDGAGGMSTATVTVTVSPVNDGPSAVNDILSTAEDTAGSVDVLVNDSDDEGGTLSIVSTGTASNGSVSFVGGTITYVPALDFFGSDSFQYTMADGQGAQATATVNVTVSPVNDAPIAAPDSYVVQLNDPLFTAPALTGVLANDVDVDSVLTAVLVASTFNGTLTLSADGSFTYTPETQCDTGDYFTYYATDGQYQTEVTTVTIKINHPPTVRSDSFFFSSIAPVLGNVLDNDYDNNGDSLAASLVSGPSFAAAFTFNNDGSFSYTPTTLQDDTFVYAASDGTSTTATTVFLYATSPKQVQTSEYQIALEAVEELEWEIYGQLCCTYNPNPSAGPGITVCDYAASSAQADTSSDVLLAPRVSTF